jgi:hypothetical protein
MHWLLIALLVSLLGLLLAAAGMARHIWLQRARLTGAEPAEVIEPADERDLESKS